MQNYFCRSHIKGNFICCNTQIRKLCRRSNFLVGCCLNLSPRQITGLCSRKHMQFLCSDSRISTRTDGCLRAVGRCCLFGIVSAVKPQITNTLIKTVYFFIQTFPDLLLPAKFCLLFFVFFLFLVLYAETSSFTIESVSSPDTIPVILIGIIFPSPFLSFFIHHKACKFPTLLQSYPVFSPVGSL